MPRKPGLQRRLRRRGLHVPEITNADFIEREGYPEVFAKVDRSRVSQPSGMQGVSVTTEEDIDVTSTFDVRPINALDFFRTGGSLTIDATQTIETAIFSTVIPLSRVGILRFFSFELNPIYTPNTVSSVITTFLRNGAPVPYMDSIQAIQTTQNRSTYILLDEDDELSIQVVRTSTISLIVRNAALPIAIFPTFSAELVGNLLLTRQLAKELEIGSKR